MIESVTFVDLLFAATLRGRRRRERYATRRRPTVPCCPVCAHLDAVPTARSPR